MSTTIFKSREGGPPEGYGYVYEGHALSYRLGLPVVTNLSRAINNHSEDNKCLNTRTKIEIYNGDLKKPRWESDESLKIGGILTDIGLMTAFAYKQLEGPKRLQQLLLATIITSAVIFSLNTFVEQYAALEPLIKLQTLIGLGVLSTIFAHPVCEARRVQEATSTVSSVTKLSQQDVFTNWSNPNHLDLP